MVGERWSDGSDPRITRFEVELPQPRARWRRARVLHNALRATATTDYLKAYWSEAGELVLGAQVPAEVLTPEVEEGVRRSLNVFAPLTAKDLPRSRAWMTRVERCLEEQAASFSLSFDWDAIWAIPRLLEDQGFTPISARDRQGHPIPRAGAGFEPLDDGAFIADLGLAPESAGPDPVPPSDSRVVIHPGRSGVSFTARVGAGRWKRNGDRLGRLLALNARTDVATLGLDEYDGVVITYQVPQLTADLVRHARQQLTAARAGVLEIRGSP